MTQLLIQKRTLLDGSLQRRPEKRKLESQCILPCDKNDDSVISIHLLNDDCLKEIFAHFSMVEKLKMSMVCKRWYNLWLHQMSMCDVDYLIFVYPEQTRYCELWPWLAWIWQNYNCPKSRGSIIGIFQWLPAVALTLSAVIFLSEEVFKMLWLTNLPTDLKHLFIPSSRVGQGKYLCKIISKATNLETVHMTVMGDASNVEGDVLIQSIAHCSSLRVIHLLFVSGDIALRLEHSERYPRFLEQLPGYDKYFGSFLS